MTYDISINPDKGYISIIVIGNIDNAKAMSINIEAHELGRKHNIRKYLMDLRDARNIEDVMQNYNFAYKDMKADDRIDRSAVVALVVSPEDHSHDFIETVALNTGLNVRLFRDLMEAEIHLIGMQSK